MGWYFRSGIIINIVLSVLIYSSLFFFDVPVIRIFNKEADGRVLKKTSLKEWEVYGSMVVLRKNEMYGIR